MGFVVMMISPDTWESESKGRAETTAETTAAKAVFPSDEHSAQPIYKENYPDDNNEAVRE